jgi:hypothetical protein
VWRERADGVIGAVSLFRRCWILLH